MPGKPEFLTTREMADLLRVKERKIYDLAGEGGIPCRRITGKLLFPRLEIEAWLRGDAAEGAPHSVTQILPNVIAGSHDPLLDWAIRESGCGLATLFDGSLDGLEKLFASQAMAAGMHVFEPDGDAPDWNRAHVSERLADQNFVLMEFARREQGLVLSRDVAADIRTLADLPGRRLVCRQSSAGSQLLLESLLAAEGIDLADIRCLPEPVRTETEIAAMVASGAADAGPGLRSVAEQFGLPFMPTLSERFDLVVDRRHYFEPPFQKLLVFMRSSAFATKAAALPGYDITGLGNIHWNA
ncbi:MAG: helix-turn-helix transcriptional regulator [Nitratireductor sp.]